LLNKTEAKLKIDAFPGDFAIICPKRLWANVLLGNILKTGLNVETTLFLKSEYSRKQPKPVIFPNESELKTQQQKTARKEGRKLSAQERMIANNLKQAEPALDIDGLDRKLLEIACQDWANFLEFTRKQEADCGCPNQETSQSLKENQAETESFLAVWSSMWLKKWKQRVKLLIGSQSQQGFVKSSKAVADVEPVWNQLKCKQEMVDMIVYTLIKNGEICGTEVTAHSLIKLELGKRKGVNVDDQQEALSILNKVLCRAREMAQGISPYIYVKVDKNYYARAQN
jgi:hypothetical protein